MARYSEIYPRNPDDPNYKSGQLHTDDSVEILIGMIKQCMMTTPGFFKGDTRDSCVIDFAIKGNPILGIKII